MIGDTKDSFRSHRLLIVFLFDVLLAGVAQTALSLSLTAATALFGVLQTICKIVVSH